MNSVVAHFIGGPKDGTTMTMRHPPNLRYLVPVAAPLDVAEPTAEVEAFEVYELVYVNGRPSIDDNGEYRYRHQPRSSGRL